MNSLNSFLFFCLCFLLSCFSSPNNKFIITVKTNGYDGDTIKLLQVSFLDTSTKFVVIPKSPNGLFEYQGKINGTISCHILTNTKISDIFFLEAGPNDVEVLFDSLIYIPRYEGDIYSVSVNNATNNLYSEYKRLTISNSDKNQHIIDSIKSSNLNSYLTPYILLANPVFNRSDYEALSSRVKNSFYGQELLMKLNSYKNLKSSQYEFSANDINGDSVYSENLFTDHVLINFWASYCLPCISKFKELKDIKSKYENLQIISISIDQFREEQWKELVYHHGIDDWPNILATHQNKIISLFNIEVLPTYFIKNKDSFTKYTDLDINELDSLLSCQIVSRCK